MKKIATIILLSLCAMNSKSDSYSDRLNAIAVMACEVSAKIYAPVATWISGVQNIIQNNNVPKSDVDRANVRIAEEEEKFRNSEYENRLELRKSHTEKLYFTSEENSYYEKIYKVSMENAFLIGRKNPGSTQIKLQRLIDDECKRMIQY